ncbi:disulfide bond formation protein DsbA (plasmid) [Paenibacillus sp. IHB B 3084]|uniref:DsbA family oxidoreductase n=1 Tax=Paenibacillus TaxID=44249 RepID=UPI0007207EF4|nr:MULTISPECIES: DsbA family oxidoreductase [Paenibacillus]ALP39171.1 disulfide bond formation protein DsbA [Paenibacillus sp. IHB B 3084]MBE0336295.1 DsbA family oxidoreductase [Paenibacillus sp. 23TSA30-6]
MNIEVWSDYMCPFCYIGKRRLEQVVKQFPHHDEVQLTFKSFELNPDAVKDSGKTINEELSAKYGVSLQEAQAMNDRMNENARTAGLQYNIHAMVPTNSLDAHRLTLWAQTQGKMLELSERLFQAVFIEGKHTGDHEVLTALAAEVGLDRDEAAAVLASDRFTDEVRADEAEGAELGVRGVPFFVFDRKFAVSGAQPDEVFHDALQKAWDERSPFTMVSASSSADDAGGVCTDDGCELPHREN